MGNPSSESLPVDLLTTSAAQLYTHLHPILTLGTLAANFSSLVADPVQTLTYLLVPLSIFQAIYAATCIPQAPDTRPTPTQNQQSTPSKQSATSTPQPRRRPKQSTTTQASIASRITQSTLATLLSLLLPPLPLFIILVLHGAPITTHIPHTFLLATHLSLLSTLPLFYAHGVSSSKWSELVSLSAPIDELLGAALGTLLGAWVGAVPIPLDWDREWQKWPVTVVVGAYGGWALGKVVGGLVLKGRRVRFED